MRHYELVVVFSPRLTEEQLAEETEKVKTLLVDSGAMNTEVEQWGRRELAYKLSKSKVEQGVYVCYYYSTEKVELNERVIGILRITEPALLYQVHRLEGKERKYQGRTSYVSSDDDFAGDFAA